MANIVLGGYATIDFVAQAAGPLVTEGTNFVEVSRQGWPRAGGAPLFAGVVLAAGGHKVSPLLMIGDDAACAMFAAQAMANGMSTKGIVSLANVTTPICLLIHQAVGGYCCFLDPGTIGASRLSENQLAIQEEADWVVITAGPIRLLQDILGALRPTQKLAWILKADAASFPVWLCRQLRERASVVFCNREERNFLGSTDNVHVSRDQIVFETDGERGVTIVVNGSSICIPTTSIAVADATGAGDTFAGGALSVLVNTPMAVECAARAGVIEARKLLESRVTGGIKIGNDVSRFPSNDLENAEISSDILECPRRSVVLSDSVTH